MTDWPLAQLSRRPLPNLHLQPCSASSPSPLSARRVGPVIASTPVAPPVLFLLACLCSVVDPAPRPLASPHSPPHCWLLRTSTLSNVSSLKPSKSAQHAPLPSSARAHRYALPNRPVFLLSVDARLTALASSCTSLISTPRLDSQPVDPPA